MLLKNYLYKPQLLACTHSTPSAQAFRLARVHHKVTNFPSTPPDNTRKRPSLPPLESFSVTLTRHGIVHQLRVERSSKSPSTSTQGALSGTPLRPLPSRTHIALRATHNQDLPVPDVSTSLLKRAVLWFDRLKVRPLCSACWQLAHTSKSLGQLSTSESAHR
jgi:hypothetical protein